MRLSESIKIKVIQHIVNFFGADLLRMVYKSCHYGRALNRSLEAWLLSLIVIPISCFVNIEKFKYSFLKRTSNVKEVYVLNQLNAITHNIYNLPEVIVSNDRRFSINVLVPAYDIQGMSAGFLGIFQLALKISLMGYHVRLVMFENFNFNIDELRQFFLKTTGLDTLFKQVEVYHIRDRYKPLKVSSHDVVVATVWYSAYFAQKISVLNNKPFLYLIQDYEARFFPCGALSTLADATYNNMNYHGLVSSKPLFQYLKKMNKCSTKFVNDQMMCFNNASTNKRICKQEFMERRLKKTRKFVFYSRPTVDRNMFPLASLAIINSFKQKIFNNSRLNWEFYGMGMGNAEIELNNHTKITQIPRMPLKEYEATIQSFDVCLTLMASPHPSLIPFDLAGVGAIVVTNVFATKDREYFLNISKNIIAVPPTLDDLVFAIKKAIHSAELFENRYEAAVNMNYPKSWENTWTPNVENFIDRALGGYTGSQNLDQDYQKIRNPSYNILT